jgi:predicted membrane protein
MLGPLKALTFILGFMVAGTILSEVSYKKKPLREVLANWRPLLLRVIVGYVVLMVASLLYFKLGKH